MTRKSLSAPARWLRNQGLLKGRILDFGCGLGKDAELLNIDGWDPFHPSRPLFLNPQLNTYDTILCVYVLNVIEEEERRNSIEDRIIELLKPGGDAFIVVRGDKKELTGRKRWGTWQGFVIPTNRWKEIKSGKFRVYHHYKKSGTNHPKKGVSMSWTKGPWIAEEWSGKPTLYAVRQPKGKTVATICTRPGQPEEEHKNARLIAAAPSLYDAGHHLAMLGLQSDRYDNDPEFREVVDRILDIIKEV